MPVRVALPDSWAAWLLTEISESDGDQVYGLAQVGRRPPALGWHSLAEMDAMRGSLGARVALDEDFEPKATLCDYARVALATGRIEYTLAGTDAGPCVAGNKQTIPAEMLDRLRRNGLRQAASRGIRPDTDLWPIVRLFVPGSQAVWLLTETDPRDPSIAFGLCDLGLGSPELGYMDLDEVVALRFAEGLGVEVDLDFRAAGPISLYAEHARRVGRIEV